MHLEKGVATREDIDKTLKLGMNHPMGPLQLGMLPLHFNGKTEEFCVIYPFRKSALADL